MKVINSKTQFMFVLVFVSTTVAAQINVLDNYNGDFEYGTFDHWRFVEVADSTAGSFAEIVENPFKGDYAAKITWKSGGAHPIDLVLDNWNTKVEVVAGNTYSLNAAIMAIGETGLLLHCTLGFFNSEGAVINESTSNWVLEESYDVKEHVGIAPQGATNCWIAFRLFAENGARWPSNTGITLIDEVELWETETVTTHVVDDLLQSGIKMYPNPVQYRLTIESENKIDRIEIYNLQGHLLKKSAEVYNTIEMESLSAGFYILNVYTETKCFIRTIIKQ